MRKVFWAKVFRKILVFVIVAALFPTMDFTGVSGINGLTVNAAERGASYELILREGNSNYTLDGISYPLESKYTVNGVSYSASGKPYVDGNGEFWVPIQALKLKIEELLVSGSVLTENEIRSKYYQEAPFTFTTHTFDNVTYVPCRELERLFQPYIEITRNNDILTISIGKTDAEIEFMGTIKPEIIRQSRDVTVEIGQEETIFIEVMSPITFSPVFQWYTSTDGNNYGGTAISGATTRSYTPPTGPAMIGKTSYYYCVVTHTDPNPVQGRPQTSSATSEVIKVTVTRSRSGSPTAKTPESIINNSIILRVGSPQALVNNNLEKIDDELTSAPFIDGNGRTLVPVRFIAENLGCSVETDFSVTPQKITLITPENARVTMHIGQNALDIKSDFYTNTIAMDTSPVMNSSSRTFIPVRPFIVNGLAMKIAYFADKKIIVISNFDIGDVNSQLASDVAAYAEAMLPVEKWQYPMKGYTTTWDWEDGRGRSENDLSWGWKSADTSFGDRRYHVALDLSSSVGDYNIYPASKGTVVKCSNNNNGGGANGRYVILKHTIGNKDVFSFYCHLSSVKVTEGQDVDLNDVIGVMGGSGNGIDNKYGPHLHFSIMDTLYAGGGYDGYAYWFSNDYTRHNSMIYYNPVFVIRNSWLP